MDDPSRDPAANDPATTWPRSGARSTYEKSLGQDDLSRQEAWATRAQAGSGLKRALRRARLDEAERTEVIADLRGAEIARLEMLQEELAPLLSEVPETIDLFDVAIMPGARPRLFIDMIGFVELAHDRRTYRFVQDTRHGRTALAESADIDEMIDAIADYMAHRLIEREKALASDVRSDRAGRLRRSVKGERPAKKPRDSADLEASQLRLARGEAAFSRTILAILSFLIEVLGSAAFFLLLLMGGSFLWKSVVAWSALR